MKSIFYKTVLIMTLTAVVLAGCSKSPADKMQRLKELKSLQIKELEEIERLEKELEADAPKDTATVKSREISVVELKTRAFDHYVLTQASIQSIDNIMVSAKSPGIVTSVFAKEGEVITKGQVLAQIDNSLVSRQIEEVKANMELARTVYERQKNLWDQKIGTEVQFLQAKNSKEGLERRLATLNEQLDMARIKSPITGTVDEVHIKVGENAAPGMPVFRVVNSNDLKATAKVSEAYVTNIHKGDKAFLTIGDLNKTIEARVTFVGRNIDALTRSFSVEVKLNSSPDLRPNMTCVLKVIFHSEKAALCIPVNVVQDIDGSKVVYIAESKGSQLVARRREVKVVGVYDNLAEIEEGLHAGERIITVGYQGLSDGQIVKI